MYAMNQLEHLCSLKAKVTDLISYGATPWGMRMDAHFEGDVAGGILNGKVRGVDYITVRSDGVAELNVRASVQTDDGICIGIEAKGYGKDGELKDAHIRIVTGHEKYNWLTSKVIVGKGRSADGGIELDYYYKP
ncbi:MAG: DUF3237 domain-containing protein [Deltaproteobacteria bacterium]|nr:DUF3237 domain-containing protein [Deltaproteobacteria bacterium]